MAAQAGHPPPHRPQGHRVLDPVRPRPLGGREGGVLVRRLPLAAPPLRAQGRALPRHSRSTYQPPQTHRLSDNSRGCTGPCGGRPRASCALRLLSDQRRSRPAVLISLCLDRMPQSRQTTRSEPLPRLHVAGQLEVGEPRERADADLRRSGGRRLQGAVQPLHGDKLLIRPDEDERDEHDLQASTGELRARGRRGPPFLTP